MASRPRRRCKRNSHPYRGVKVHFRRWTRQRARNPRQHWVIRSADWARPPCMMVMTSPRSWIVSLFQITRSPQPISHFHSSLSLIPETATFNPHWITPSLHHQTKRACRLALPPRHPTLCSLAMVRNYHHFSQKEHRIYPTEPGHQRISSR